MIRRPQRYPSDMKDKEWKIVQPLLPPAATNQQNKLRQILDAIFYIDKTGCQWRRRLFQAVEKVVNCALPFDVFV